MPRSDNPRHFLKGDELGRDELLALLDVAAELKRHRRPRPDLAGRSLLLLFEKPSLRTHVSFSLAMQELGGYVVESFANCRKHEEPEDMAGVLGGYGDAIVLRAFDHAFLERMGSRSPVPVINGLSDSHHPCQTLADLLTLREAWNDLRGRKLAYVGDGNNILHSLLLLLPYLGAHVAYSTPGGYAPDPEILAAAQTRAALGGGSISAHAAPSAAVADAHAVYTDVWTSMGFEGEDARRRAAFAGFQLNEDLYAHARPDALVLHCLPMVRGREITDAMADHPNSAIFRQSENRLHAQKALLLSLLSH